METLRLADSARRYAPDNPTARLIYARALLQSGAYTAAAESLLGLDDVDARLLCVEAAHATDRRDASAALCATLLRSIAVDSAPSLGSLAGRVAQACDDRFAGWVGVDSRLRIVGELHGVRSATIEWGDASVETIAGGADRPWFSVKIPEGVTGPIRVHAGSRPLLGSDMPWPLDFGLRGWVVLEGRQLTGEVTLGWHDQMPVSLVVAPGRAELRLKINSARTTGIGRPFSVPMDDLTLDHHELQVTAVLPDGTLAPLIGSPIRLPQRKPQPIVSLPTAFKKPEAARQSPPPISIVIPVYGGLNETLTCLRSVLATVPLESAVITVIDDAGPDPQLKTALDVLARNGRFTLLRNSINLGFPGTANRGMRLHPDRDVVLLNADAEVFAGWLERLQRVAYGGDAIGTVTPLGEHASIVSYAGKGGKPRSSSEAARIDRAAGVVNSDEAVDIPVGVGFCLYLRRQCLEEIGEFDETAFGRGYGEENDFCLRARRHGWRHVAAPGVFVRHVGSRSFGRARELLMARNRRVINHRYPGYDALIDSFSTSDPLAASRRALDSQLLIDSAHEPILLVTLSLKGGVKRHVEERRAKLEAQGQSVLLLRADTMDFTKDTVHLRVDALDLDHLKFGLPDELDALRGFLLRLGVVRIELHHFLGLPESALTMLLGLGVPYRVVIHDYLWVCPRVSFIDGNGYYCGEPAVMACESCVARNGSAIKDLPSVAGLRDRSAQILAGADEVIVPVQDVATRLKRYFPNVAFVIEAWEGPITRIPRARTRENGRARVLLMGAIGAQKGYGKLLECARDAVERDLSLEFVVVGHSEDDATLLETGRIFLTGPYEEPEVAGLLERERGDVAWFPTMGPETWCYTLSHVLAQDMPILAFDLGAVAERLREAGTGVLVPWTTSAVAINDELLRLTDEARKNNKARSLEKLMGSSSGSETLAAAEEMVATVQVLNLPVGLYAFTVQSGVAVASGEVLLPALQIAPAPVRSSARIEFLSGPATLDRWLTQGGDVVTVKVSGGDATLLLTSLRGRDSGVLSIDVRRLDAPTPDADEAEAAPAGAPAVPKAAETRVITLVHVPYLGDLSFTHGWAGKPSENLWIEGFSVAIEEPDLSDLVEYCGVSEEGNVTDWTTGGQFCGARGTGIPFIAYSARIKSSATADYTCLYSGRFLSGAVVGPWQDGRFCRSDVPGDPLVAMEIRVVPNRPDLASAAVQ